MFERKRIQMQKDWKQDCGARHMHVLLRALLLQPRLHLPFMGVRISWETGHKEKAAQKEGSGLSSINLLYQNLLLLHLELSNLSSNTRTALLKVGIPI